jgi:hypothetical protein
VHDPTHLGRGKKDTVLHSLDPQKAVTGAMSANLTLDDATSMRGS